MTLSAGDMVQLQAEKMNCLATTLPSIQTRQNLFLAHDAPPTLSRHTSRDLELDLCGLPLVREEHMHFIPTTLDGLFSYHATSLTNVTTSSSVGIQRPSGLEIDQSLVREEHLYASGVLWMDAFGIQQQHEGVPEMPLTCETVAFETVTRSRHTVEHAHAVNEDAAEVEEHDADAEPVDEPTHSVHCKSADQLACAHAEPRAHLCWTSHGNSDRAIKEYLFTHCCIAARDLKPNALSRMRDLGDLFHRLQDKGIVDLSLNGPIHSVFGFSHFTVYEIADFNAEVTRMVCEDGNNCWKANGRTDLRQPTSTVYELLRQLGVHPVKGTRGKGTPSGTRDFMFYREYAFDLERLKRNCPRLRIGAIGNRRTYTGTSREALIRN